MFKVFEIVKLVLQLFPLIIQAVKTVEAALPGAGNGSTKLELIRTTIEAAYAASNQALGQFETVWPVVKKTVEGIVNAFNTSGVFKK